MPTPESSESLQSPDSLLHQLWDDYVRINPQAQAIHDLLAARGETVVNDHIALRTFDTPGFNVVRLAEAFTAVGYHPAGEYTFQDKHLYARHYEHDDPSQPKVFISELQLAAFSPDLRSRIERLLEQVDDAALHSATWPVAGRPWKIAFSDYQALAEESEYAAWMAAFGWRANHFTVLVNALDSFKSLEELNAFLKSNGYALNSSGGEIKGSAQVYLEQSSTLAAQVPVTFTDGRQTIPGCYYEFARRYPMPDGKLFQGFVTRSADKIFESTDRRGRS